ncbi:MAG: MoaD/ThiS family protein [Pseudomonadales bacterium]|nr:MoaD/ThiS family protein [Pseudomonadales bacterium]MDG1441452.1 MoaD/ThiS family protein [Pseudomonadales bacterium]
MKISLSPNLQAAADGEESISIVAATIGELLSKLATQYPNMSQHLDAGIAVAIDGQIYRDDWGKKIPTDAEIYLLPRIQGG